MGRNRPPIPSPWKPALSQDFKQSEMSFYCLLKMCHVSPTGWALVCINLFLSAAGAMNIWGERGDKGPGPWGSMETPQWNGDIWSLLTPGSPTMGNHAAPRRSTSRSVQPIHCMAKSARPALSPGCCFLFFLFGCFFFCINLGR